MTTLAAIQGDGWCVIGCESKAATEDGQFAYMATSKIFANGQTLIAGSGTVRGLNILEHGWTAPRYRSKTPEAYITRTFIPSMRKAMIESGSEIKRDDKTASFENGLLVAVKGKVFSIADDYSWETTSHNLYHSGSGGQYALAAMIALLANNVRPSIDQARDVLQRAIEVAIQCDVYSGGKINIVTQYA